MRFRRYLVVGTIAFAVDFGLLLALAQALPVLVANTVAFLVANAVNFVLAHRWVFREDLRDASVGRKYAAVLAVSMVGLVLNDAVIWIGVEWLRAGLVPSKVAATAIVLFWNYAARLRWVYREARP